MHTRLRFDFFDYASKIVASKYRRNKLAIYSVAVLFGVFFNYSSRT